MSVFYPQATYIVEFIDQALGEASTGTPQLVLRFKVLGPVDPADPDHYASMDQPQYERTSYLAITEKTMEFLPGKLASIGYTGGSISRLHPEHPQHHSFIGKTGRMFCKHEPGQNGGEPREKWDIARTSGPLEVKPVDRAKLRGLDALFARQAKASGTVKQDAVPKATEQHVPAGRPVTAEELDDVPFGF